MKLVINADDFGYTPLSARGLLKASSGDYPLNDCSVQYAGSRDDAGACEDLS